MRRSLNSHIARSAALHEKSGSLNEAAKLWRQANEIAVLKANLDWTAHRAHVCEKRLQLQAKPLRVRNGGWHSLPNPLRYLAALCSNSIFFSRCQFFLNKREYSTARRKSGISRRSAESYSFSAFSYW